MATRVFGVAEKGRIDEDLEDYLKIAQFEIEVKRPTPIEFKGVIEDSELEEMEEEVERLEGKMTEGKNAEVALLGEWAVFEGIKNGWLGDTEVKVQPASKYDDYKKGNDLICEIPVEEKVIQVAIDVTTANAITGKDALRGAKTIFEKINRILDRAKKGVHAGMVELFRSQYGSKKYIGHQEMLKAIVVIAEKDVLRIAGLARKAKFGDTDALKKLEQDKFKFDFLAQVMAAVKHAEKHARLTIRNQGKGSSAINVASRIASEAEQLEAILEEAGKGGDMKIQNELVDMIFNGTVPKALVEAINKIELDEFAV